MSPDFTKIAPYLKDPLVLIGFFLFISFLFSRYLIKQKVIPPLPPSLGFRVLKSLLLYGFIIGLALLCLGFGLKYKELRDKAEQQRLELKSREEQQRIERELREQEKLKKAETERKNQENVVHLLQGELNSNLQVANELRKNTITLLGEFQTLSSVVRTPGIKLLAAMFPSENLNLSYSDTKASSLADSAYDQIESSQLYKDDLEKQKLTAAAQRVAATIDATMSTVQSLRDDPHRRYSFSSQVWDANLPSLKQVIVADITPYQTSYADLNRLRNDYDVIASQFVEYLSAMRDFFDPAKHLITRDSLRKVLARERYALQLITAFGKSIQGEMTSVRRLQTELTGKLSKLALSADTPFPWIRRAWSLA